MAENRRDLVDTGADPDRDSRVESLLVEGLDRYFIGHYEDAIHIWTRVLFVDRAHPRARAYIDRARAALAERQRHSDELLHTSQAMLDQGRTSDARQLLSEAIAVSGDDERAAALRMRLDRAERARTGVAPADVEPDPAVSDSDAFLQSPAVWWSLVTATALVTLWLVGRLAFPWQPAEPTGAPAVVTASTVRVLNSSEVALVRARTFYARGRLADALRALDRVAIDSELRVEADQLRVEIQRLLLAADAERATSPGRLH
jgi:hypothetical protein